MPSVRQDVLQSLLKRGHRDTVLEARLDFSEWESFRRYVEPLEGQGRAHPDMLPTQASGRWSTTDPPLVNFPPDCINPACPQVGTEHMARGLPCWSVRDVIVPDPGWWWLGFDWQAVEARIAAADAGDEEDLEAFAKGYDIHLFTLCTVFGLSRPPDLTHYHTSPECAEWREKYKWQGKDDRRRIVSKNVKYGLAYAKNEKGLLALKGIGKLGLSTSELLRIGRMYLTSKPKYKIWKTTWWYVAASTGETRTCYGTRRKLFGLRESVEKEGLNHRVQGTVADMMDEVIINFQAEWPESRIVYQSHDGLKWAFPVSHLPSVVMPRAREIIEAEREIGGRKIPFPADFTTTQGGTV